MRIVEIVYFDSEHGEYHVIRIAKYFGPYA